MQEKVEIITNHIVHIWTILDKNTQKRIQCLAGNLNLGRSYLIITVRTQLWEFVVYVLTFESHILRN